MPNKPSCYFTENSMHPQCRLLWDRAAAAERRAVEAEEIAHYANGVADLAMKQRDEAEKRAQGLNIVLSASARAHESALDRAHAATKRAEDMEKLAQAASDDAERAIQRAKAAEKLAGANFHEDYGREMRAANAEARAEAAEHRAVEAEKQLATTVDAFEMTSGDYQDAFKRLEATEAERDTLKAQVAGLRDAVKRSHAMLLYDSNYSNEPNSVRWANEAVLSAHPLPTRGE